MTKTVSLQQDCADCGVSDCRRSWRFGRGAWPSTEHLPSVRIRHSF